MGIGIVRRWQNKSQEQQDRKISA